MAIVGNVAAEIARGAGLVPARRAISQPTFWCWQCDRPYEGTMCGTDAAHVGLKHGSAAECGWYQGLCWQQSRGAIHGLHAHPVFRLPGDIRYTADAGYTTAEGVRCVAEYKSRYTAQGREWRRTRRLFAATYPDLTLVEVVE